jgi:hypothetical protein
VAKTATDGNDCRAVVAILAAAERGCVGVGGIHENERVDWATATATALGAAVAIVTTVIAHLLTTRDSRKGEHRSEQRQSYFDFALAAEAAHDALRLVGDPHRESENLAIETRRAVSESGIYGAREKLLVAASPALNEAGDRVLKALSDVRRAIRDGAKLNTSAYHDVYHPLADALWELRRVARREFGHRPLQPQDIGRSTWESRATCEFCSAARAAGVPAQRS